MMPAQRLRTAGRVWAGRAAALHAGQLGLLTAAVLFVAFLTYPHDMAERRATLQRQAAAWDSLYREVEAATEVSRRLLANDSLRYQERFAISGWDAHTRWITERTAAFEERESDRLALLAQQLPSRRPLYSGRRRMQAAWVLVVLAFVPWWWWFGARRSPAADPERGA